MSVMLGMGQVLHFGLFHGGFATSEKRKERQHITGSNCLKGVSHTVIVDEKGIKDSWK